MYVCLYVCMYVRGLKLLLVSRNKWNVTVGQQIWHI